MDMLFGDATTAIGTPATRAEQGSLLSSPVPSMDIRGRQIDSTHGPSSAIPGLDIDPPSVSIQNGKPQYSNADGDNGEGVGGWIARMVSRTRGGNGEGSVRSGKSGRSGKYKPVGQGDD